LINHTLFITDTMASSYLRIVDVGSPCADVPQTAYTFPLDPFQQHAVSAIYKHENVLVTAKTGSGKTLVGEYQIAHSLSKGRRVFYTTPIKSLSNQKFHDLKQMWPGQVGIMTGDIKFQPDAPIVIMTTEILRNLLFKQDSSTSHLGLSASLSLDNLDAVVFDEVHYINNQERGRVWEETLILLPRSVNLVLLSATIDGPELFASWLGELKQKPIHLISTVYRIVPLTHGVLRGKNVYPIMDHKERFNALSYTDWIRSRKEREDSYKEHKQKVVNRRLGGYEDPVVSGDKRPSSYLHQLNECIVTLYEGELLPALFFSFSRKSCETFASKVEGSLITTSEAASVKHIIDFHLHHYPAVYKATKQFFTVTQLLMRGVAFHHSGLLPLLKEIIEVLFAKGLVKVLFATETFAVGINMPTKTVVFTSYEKFDDSSNGMRMLYTDEYIQMAGRAGRRGKDTEGLVLYLPEREPVGVQELQRMMTGSKSTFVSRMNFHYDFILKTLHSKNTSWIGLMTQSYWYQQHQRALKVAERECAALETKLAASGLTPEILANMRRREELELAMKTSVNAAKKKAQQALEQWKNKHLAPVFAIQWTTYHELKKLEKELEEHKNYLRTLENHHETVYPLLHVLVDTGFLEPFEDPVHELRLTTLGTMATELNEGNPLLMSYAFNKGLCDTLTGEEIVCFLCAFLNEGKEPGPPIRNLQIPAAATTALFNLDNSLDVFFPAEKKHGVLSPAGFWELNSFWIEPVWRWIQGDTISSICDDYGLYEGNFMRVIMKVSNLLEEFTSLATFTQNVELLSKLEGLPAKLVRDVAVPESLYLRM
jgi:superfamily II RNA helicase